MTTTNRNGDIDEVEAKLQQWREGMDKEIRAGKYGPEKITDFKHVEDIDCTPKLRDSMDDLEAHGISRHYTCNILMKDDYDENVDVVMAVFKQPSTANISTAADPTGRHHDNYGATYDKHSGQCELRPASTEGGRNFLKCWRQE